MKKIYLNTLLFGLVSLGATAQVSQIQNNLQSAHTSPTATNSIVNSPVYAFSKAAGDVLMSVDFANDPLTNGWTTSGADGAIWMRDTDGPNGQFSNPATQIITSTTAGNGFLIFDADNANPAAPYTNWVGSITSPAFDMTGVVNGVLMFQHTYRTCCSADFIPQAEFSTDGGTTWTSYDVTVSGIGVNDVAPTTVAKVNLTAALAGVANLTACHIRFTWDGAAGSSHYYWQIDDVQVIESHDNDNTALSRFMVSGAEEIPYYSVPVEQQTAITFSGEVRNDGGMSNTNVQLDVTADNGGGTVSSPSTTLAPAAMDSLVTATWTPAATAPVTYNLTYDFTLAETDGIPADNQLTDAFNITTSEYAVHNGVSTGSIAALSGQQGQPLKIGNIMEVFADDVAGYVYVGLANTATNVGQEFFGEVYKYNGSNFVFEATTTIETITAANNGSLVQLPLTNNINVTAGDVLLVVAGHNGGTDNVAFAMAQPIAQGIVQGFDATGSGFQLTNPSAIMVGLDLEPNTIGLDELENGITIGNVFPNPTTGVTTVNYSLANASDVAINVVDVTGKTIQTLNEGTQVSGGHTVNVDLSNFTNGVYFIEIATDATVVTKRVVKK